MTVSGVHRTSVASLRPYERLPHRLARVVTVPRLRTPDLTSGMLTLVTLQSREAYQVLARDGVLCGDPMLGDPDFSEAYGWMAEQMRHRLPTTGNGMLWAWARTPRTAVVEHARQVPGSVLLTLRVARDRVLLSDYIDWHQVLNRCINIAPLPGETDAEWGRRFDVEWDAWDERTRCFDRVALALWPLDLRAEIEASWEAIFDLATIPPHRSLQATVHELTERDVVRAVRIN
ncbi:DUF3841 domain-containing protein [Isoptericola haloaureus]|uniref:DUF3841 domain-containing protein n=1 Tax=Isoptericola haloaureus TaxID=1542902 RepID=A0ABU7Z593_9MICO